MLRGNILYGLGAIALIALFFLPWMGITHDQGVDQVFDKAVTGLRDQAVAAGQVPAGTTVKDMAAALAQQGKTKELIVAGASQTLAAAQLAELQSGKTWTGLQMATKGREFMGDTKGVDPLLWIILGAGVLGLIIAGLAMARVLPRRFAGFLAIVIGVGIVAVLFFSKSLSNADWELVKKLPDYAQYGLWGTIGGAAASLVGGLIDLF